jgi:hypothetical protein
MKTILKEQRFETARTLPQLIQRLEAWRADRPRGQRIPEELWRDAAELARQHGISPIATALKLSYYDLQRRVQSSRSVEGKQIWSSPAFVELPAWPAREARSDAGTLELTGADGARLTLRLPPVRTQELWSVVALWLGHRI